MGSGRARTSRLPCQDRHQLGLVRVSLQATVQHLHREAKTNAPDLVTRWGDSPKEAALGKGAVRTSRPGPRDVAAAVLDEKRIRESVPKESGHPKMRI